MKVLKLHGTFAIFILLNLSAYLHGEICMSDENCQLNEFCGEAHVGGEEKLCKPCFQCQSAYRKESSRIQRCARHRHDCGDCIPDAILSFSDEGFLNCILQPLNEDWNATELLDPNAEVVNIHYDDEAAQSVGAIVGGVALGVVAVIVMGVIIFYGVKYLRSKDKKKKNKEEEPSPTELQELRPQPMETTVDLEN